MSLPVQLFLLALLVAPAQQPKAKPVGVVTGVVVDSLGAPISGVTVTDKSSRFGTTTDSLGRFRLSLQEQRYDLSAVHLGYRSRVSIPVVVSGGTEVHLRIILRRHANEPPAPSNVAYPLDIIVENHTHQLVLYEPLLLTVQLANPSDVAIPTSLGLFPDFRDLSILITRPDGIVVPYHPGGLEESVRGQTGVQIAPHSALFYDLPILWNAETLSLAFPWPGRYTLIVQLRVRRMHGDVWLESSPVQIHALEPEGVDLRLIKKLGSGDALLTVLRHGTWKYCDPPRDPDCKRQLSKLIARYERSSYAEHLCRALAIGEQGEYLRAIAIEECLGNWPDSPYAPRLLYLLALNLKEAGRIADARRRVDEFLARWPEREAEGRSLSFDIGPR